MFSIGDCLCSGLCRLGIFGAVLGLLVVATMGTASADALADCNEAERPAARIAGCTSILDAGPSAEVRAIALMNRGIGHAAAGDLEDALTDFDSAIEISPGLIEGYYNRGNVNLDLERSEDAIRDFSTVIEAEPQFALGWLNRGLAREQAGDREGARRDIGRALALNSSLDSARRALARLRKEQ
jgi:tetratricopeptide (TPR) repeat protein